MPFYLFLVYLASLNNVHAKDDSSKNVRIYMEDVVGEAISLAESEINKEQKLILEEAPKTLSSDEPKNVENWLKSMARGILCSGKYQKNMENQNGMEPDSEYLARRSIKEQTRIRKGILEESESQNRMDSLKFSDQFCSDLNDGMSIMEAAKGLVDPKFLVQKLYRDLEIQKRIAEAKSRSKIVESKQKEQNFASKRDRFMDRVYLTFDKIVKGIQNQANICNVSKSNLPPEQTGPTRRIYAGRRKRHAGTSSSSAADDGTGNRKLLWVQNSCVSLLFLIFQSMVAIRRQAAVGESRILIGVLLLLLTFNFILHCILLRNVNYAIELVLPDDQ